MSARDAAEQVAIFAHGSEHLVDPDELRARLGEGRPLRVKYGCDPSAPDLHLGHTVPLEKLRQLQELGHTIVFLIGDFTALIGDPTGRSKTRPPLEPDQVAENARTYTEQVGSVLDVERIEIRFNSEWMNRFSAADFVRLASHQPVARMLERDDFKRRFQSGTSISIHEFLYPLVQAYDSVALEADVELGGTDQLFNLLLGREIQRAYGQRAQIVLTMPLLEGTDGSEKMSKSVGNAVGVREPAPDMYGKVMSIPDAILPRWIELLVSPESELGAAGAALGRGEGSPRDLKAALARSLVARFHGEEAAEEAESHFDRVFRRHETPADLEVVRVEAPDSGGVPILDAVVAAGFAASRGEAKRLVQQGGVRVDEAKVTSIEARIGPGEAVLQVGKRRFCRLRVVA